MTKSITQIQQDSDNKRGVKVKGFKLKLEDIAYFEEVAKKHGFKSHNDFLMHAVKFFDENKKPD